MVHSDFGAHENKVCHSPFFPHLFAMKRWDWPASYFFEYGVSSQLFYSLLSLSSRSFLVPLRFCHYSGIMYMSEVAGISPSNLDSSLWCIYPCTLHDVLCIWLKWEGDNIPPWPTPFPILNQSAAPCLDLTIASWPAYRLLRRQVKWSCIPISLKNFHSLLWSTQSRL